jgi:hypothetical protein
MLWVGRYYEQVDLSGTDVIPVKGGGVAQHSLQFALDGWKERFVF